jgi:hypothetical protein
MTDFPAPGKTSLPGESKSPLLLRIGFWICVVIGAAAVIRRLVALAAPAHNGPPQMAGLDDAFASHTALTLSHIVPAILFVLLSPLVVFARFSRLKWPDRILFPLGAVVGLTAYAMNVYAVGGWTERIAILLFDTFFLYSLFRAFQYWRRGEASLKRRWVLRSIAIVLGVATARPVMGIFFATSPLTHLAPRQFFGIAMWVGFSVNVLVFELWIRSLDRRSRRANSSAVPALSIPGSRVQT